MPKLLPFSPAQQRLLERFEQAGGVVEFILCQSTTPHLIESHREAVRLAFLELEDRDERWAQQVAQERKIPRRRLFDIHYEAAAIEGLNPTSITVEQLLGNRYDLARRELIVYGKGEYRNRFFYAHAEPKPANILPQIDGGISEGLAYAMSSPPYPLDATPEEVDRMLQSMLHGLLNDLADDPLLLRWPTDWCNYFDAGNEWWGSFLWSVGVPAWQQIVVMAASSSD
ncbi:hypothetical protein AB1L30_08980 [Bremerella sp. JC817]|uniref:hypothetical protein n=1 Tax=Bremerella sp. JC817 TaxID=3231756 RepID=UPI00345989AB